MRADLTVKDVMSHAYLGVSESDPLRETAELFLEEDATVIAVVRGSELRGGVSERQLLHALLDESRSAGTPIEACMTAHPPTVPPEANLTEAATELADVERSHLFVVSGTELVGVVSENDVLTAVTSVLATDVGTNEEERAARGMVEDQEEPEEATTLSVQSVCEICGTLKSDLENFNGQLVCSDCRSV